MLLPGMGLEGPVTSGTPCTRKNDLTKDTLLGMGGSCTMEGGWVSLTPPAPLAWKYLAARGLYTVALLLCEGGMNTAGRLTSAKTHMKELYQLG